MREREFKRRLVEQMRIEAGQRVLDVGCGTGTLALLIKRDHPGSEVVGLDPDSQILAIARYKAERSGAQVRFEVGYADRLPYPDISFDRVTSSLVFHHLSHELKIRALQEAFRVLRSAGELHVADFGRPTSTLMRVALVPVRLVDGLGTRRDNVAGRLPAFMSEAGFREVAETARFQTPFGPVCIYRASKAAIATTMVLRESASEEITPDR
jgi:SAM-dependent methyltransferase